MELKTVSFVEMMENYVGKYFGKRVLCSLTWSGLLGCILLTSCTPSGSPQNAALEKAVPSQGPIRIGEVGSLTGTDASFGESTHKGILLAVNEINASGGIGGRKLELITLDDQGKPSEAVLAITKLIQQQKVQAVLGEVASTRSIAMAPIAQQFRVPLISPSSLNSKFTKIGDYIFRVCFVDVFQSQVMADFAYDKLKARRVAILRDINSDYSRDSAAYFEEVFKKRGGEIVIDQSYSGGDIDFQSQLTAIRAVHPDVILVPGYYMEIGLIARQAASLGLKVPLLGGDGWDSPSLGQIGGTAIQGSYYVGHFSSLDTSPTVQKFIQAFKKTFGIEPNSLAALAYDATLLLADAMKRSSSASSEDLRSALATTQNFQGVTGKITINAERNAVKSAVVFQVTEGGKLRVAETYLPH